MFIVPFFRKNRTLMSGKDTTSDKSREFLGKVGEDLRCPVSADAIHPNSIVNEPRSVTGERRRSETDE